MFTQENEKKKKEKRKINNFHFIRYILRSIKLPLEDNIKADIHFFIFACGSGAMTWGLTGF
jgi:GH24 family phage-related lysozyme (muramidase)